MHSKVFCFSVCICLSLDLQPLQITSWKLVVDSFEDEKIDYAPKSEFLRHMTLYFLEPLTTFVGCVGKKGEREHFTFPGNNM